MAILAICTVSLGFCRGYISLDPGPVLDPLCFGKICRVLLTPFSIFQGTRKRCPLSPALFILALEPLAMDLRADQVISGIPYACYDFKLNLFTDDTLLTLTNPLITLPNFQRVLCRFSFISGLCINLNKMVALKVTLAPDLVSRLQSHFLFQWTSSHTDYLGTWLTPSYSSLFHLIITHCFALYWPLCSLGNSCTYPG